MLKSAILKDKKELTHDVFELRFEMEENFQFEAGQFITIRISDRDKPCFRAYSIASEPRQDKTFDLCIKIVNEGRGSNWLNSLKPGEQIDFLGPSGKFTFQTDPEKSAIFIATGTGVAPFRSMIAAELGKGSTQNMHLLFGVRHERDLFYQDLFQNLASQHSNFSFSQTLSRPETEQWQGLKGRVTEHLSQFSPKNSEVYICGLTDMIESVVEILQTQGFNEEQIHFEKYD